MTQTGTNFTPGRYVRSAIEAEYKIAREPGSTGPIVVDAMRKNDPKRRRAAELAVELCRRGYAWSWDVCLSAVLTAVDFALIGNVADVVIAGKLVSAEEGRDELAHQWSEIAADDPNGDDWYDAEHDARPGERKARDRRFFGMLNRAMRDKLERGECVDVSTFERAGDYWIVPKDVMQDDVDFCDAASEEWIRSIGAHNRTGAIHASVGADLYQHPDYKCVWLR